MKGCSKYIFDNMDILMTCKYEKIFGVVGKYLIGAEDVTNEKRKQFIEVYNTNKPLFETYGVNEYINEIKRQIKEEARI